MVRGTLGESQLEPGGGVFDGVDLIDDDDDGFDAGPYGDGLEDDPYDELDDSHLGAAPTRGGAA